MLFPHPKVAQGFQQFVSLQVFVENRSIYEDLTFNLCNIFLRKFYTTPKYIEGDNFSSSDGIHDENKVQWYYNQEDGKRRQ